MVQKINIVATHLASQPNPSSKVKDVHAAHTQQSASSALATPPTQGQLTPSLSQLANNQPLRTHLSQLVLLLQQHAALSQPKALQKILSQLFPSDPNVLMQLLRQMVLPDKDKPSRLALMWLKLGLAQYAKDDPNLHQAIKNVLQGMQLSGSENADQHILMLQLPWFTQQQLRTIQLEFKRPKKTSKKKSRWQIQLKLPIGDNDMLAHASIEETQIQIKLYCSDQDDLARIQAHQQRLTQQLTNVGYTTQCHSFLGKVPVDLFEPKRHEHGLNITV